jgi:hypothetical protein
MHRGGIVSHEDDTGLLDVKIERVRHTKESAFLL